MMKVKKRLISIALCCFTLLLLAAPAKADDLGFGVEIVPHPKQLNAASYFDLLLDPSEETTLSFRLINSQDVPLTVELEVASARTNMNGNPDYGKKDEPMDDTLQFDMAQLIDAPGQVEIPAGKAIQLDLPLRMPAEAVRGLLAGGITFRPVSPAEEEEASGEGMVIRNRYAHVIVVTVQTDAQPDVAPHFQVNKAAAGQVNARNAILINIQNTEPTYVTWVNLQARVYKKGDSTALWEIGTPEKSMHFAPSSNMDFPLRLDGQRLEPGEFTACVDVHSQSWEQSWEQLCADFTITKEEADSLNDNDVEILQVDNTWLILAVAIGAIGLAIFITLVMVAKEKFKHKMLDELEQG